MNLFTRSLSEYGEVNEIISCLKSGRTPVQVTGCVDSQKCHLVSAISDNYRCRLIITHSEVKAKEIYEDYQLYDKNVYLYPAKDVIFYSVDIHGNAVVRDRLQVIKKIIEKEPITIIMTIDGGLDRLLPLGKIEEKVIKIDDTDTIIIEDLIKKLVQLGYERQEQVEHKGEFAVRGGIMDVYPLTEELPVRMELWGDEIDSIRIFDAESQRSIERIGSVSIYPACEAVLDEGGMSKGLKRIKEEQVGHVSTLRNMMKNEEAHRLSGILDEFVENLASFQGSVAIDSYIKYFFDDTVSFFDYFDENTLVVLDEPARLVEKCEVAHYEFTESMIGRVEKGYILPGQMDAIHDYKELLALLTRKNTVMLSALDYKDKLLNARYKYDLVVKTVNSYNNNFGMLVKDLQAWKKGGYKLILVSASKSRARRLASDLTEQDLNATYTEDMDRHLQARELVITSGNLRRGFEYPLLKFIIISESDIFGARRKKKEIKNPREGRNLNSFHDLKVGDYVVHENYGFGIYQGIEQIEVERVVKDYAKIGYGGGDVLYVLATGLDVIQKYTGQGDRKPKLNSLNSAEWRNTRTRVRSAVKEIARDLVRLYAARQSREGFAYGKDTVWQSEFEELFPYEETEDQLRAIEETKRDMEGTKIMDRLICGDVGYGKTEIAIRAAFKAVSDGRQVVFLVPTTILAQQHYNTFTQRMMDFPVSVEMLSRFRTKAQQQKVIEDLRKGKLDIVIGTHRVLSKDVVYKNLGLLVIDEEQRFGVTHKEKIKVLKENVDVLTLTATPIPRTLHMSLIGIRDMSLIDEPPIDRLPIQTFVLEHNDEIIREAINRELARNGQVYFVYNRVTGIDEMASIVSRLVPEANVAYAHGQMGERRLERIMYEFVNGEIDVLISTTIIETGLDISNVNTIIIDDADRFGLAQLYQLRGRVGRSNRTAYAFLMYKRNKVLREVAEKRLQAIKEFTELGSGYKISMRDLEIRGAGNLLGAEQSGHMEAVGYDLYCKMLNEAILGEKGDRVAEESFETTIEMDISAYIPSGYIKNEMQKLEMYKRIADIGTEEEMGDIQDELTDRYGTLPKPVNNLLNIALLKAFAHNVYAVSLKQEDREVTIAMYRNAKVNVEKIPELLGMFKGALRMCPGTVPSFKYNMRLERGRGGAKPDPDEVFARVYEVLKGFSVLI